ncbi:MAG TPA: aldehyde ferredoxin oxidoreductase [Thermoflexia bacterium]|nr:aldehyde ferredoxin oxidoreductase [Thermoflexia bacterium]
MWMLRIDMTDRSYKLEEVAERYQKLGGRGLTSTLIHDEVDPTCHPLGPNNKLVFSAGILSGTPSPSSSRISIGGKSPLTGGIKESNSGAGFAPALARMRVKAVVVEGQPAEKGAYWMVHLTWDGDKPAVEFLPAAEYVGEDLYVSYAKLYERFGKRVHVAGVGKAGELGYRNSGVAFDDMRHKPTRFSGRGGLGAVMASKGLKFVVLNSEGAPGVEYADKELFMQGAKKLRAALGEHALTKPQGALNTYGTCVLVNIINEAGAFPTRNFRTGRFAGAAKISGEAIFENNKQRMGKEIYNHACSPGCVIQCSNTIYAENGEEIVSCVEYESDWALGANCGIDDLDAIAKMVKLCNAYSLDTIETGDAIAVAMDSGLLEFGDAEGAIALIEQMGHGEPLGRILGGGTQATADAFGNPRSPAVKGQGMPAYEPRAIKGIGVTYATSTMGADHTAGYTIAPEIAGSGGKVDPLLADASKADLSRAFQKTTAMLDSTGHCLFISFAILDIPSGFEGMIEELNGMLGTHYTGDEAVAWGGEILKVERAFNEAAGLTPVDDRLPEFMKYEQLPPHDVVADVSDEIMDQVYGEL